MAGLVLEGIVLAVSSDRGHRFSKMPQRDLLLVEGHGVEGDAHAGPFVRQRYLAGRQPRLPNLRQVHLIPSELFGMLRRCGYQIGAGELGETSRRPASTLRRCRWGRGSCSDRLPQWN